MAGRSPTKDGNGIQSKSSRAMCVLLETMKPPRVTTTMTAKAPQA